MITKPNVHNRSGFSENLVAIEMRKLEVKFDKPIYVGMCILDISKTCLYEFHHEYMLPQYHEKCKIMYTDTDSLISRDTVVSRDEFTILYIASRDRTAYPYANRRVASTRDYRISITAEPMKF